VAVTYFDAENWTIGYLVVDAGNWLPGRKVLISPISLGRADEANRRIAAGLTTKQIEQQPWAGVR
jgi:hypothetical protein